MKTAVEDANKLLRGNTEFRFSPGWEPDRDTDLIPVYLVVDDESGSQMIFVPEGERFVLITEKLLLEFFSHHQVSMANQSALLSLLLLHEGGCPCNS